MRIQGASLKSSPASLAHACRRRSNQQLLHSCWVGLGEEIGVGLRLISGFHYRESVVVALCQTVWCLSCLMVEHGV